TRSPTERRHREQPVARADVRRTPVSLRRVSPRAATPSAYGTLAKYSLRTGFCSQSNSHPPPATRFQLRLPRHGFRFGLSRRQKWQTPFPGPQWPPQARSRRNLAPREEFVQPPDRRAEWPNPEKAVAVEKASGAEPGRHLEIPVGPSPD